MFSRGSNGSSPRLWRSRSSSIGLRHHLHQAHGAGAGGDQLAIQVFVAARLDAHHRANPDLRHVESFAGFADIWTPRVLGRTGRRIVAAGVRGIACRLLCGAGLRSLAGTGRQQRENRQTADAAQATKPAEVTGNRNRGRGASEAGPPSSWRGRNGRRARRPGGRRSGNRSGIVRKPLSQIAVPGKIISLRRICRRACHVTGSGHVFRSTLGRVDRRQRRLERCGCAYLLALLGSPAVPGCAPADPAAAAAHAAPSSAGTILVDAWAAWTLDARHVDGSAADGMCCVHAAPTASVQTTSPASARATASSYCATTERACAAG